jgi:hypothetical protein
MNSLASRVGSFALLALAGLAVLAVIGWETDWGSALGREATAATTPAPQRVEISLLPEYRIEGGLEARRETVERPAFVPTRRPPPAQPQAAEAPQRMQRGQFTLTGTALVDKRSIAFLRENAGGKSRSVRAGETVNGLTVAEVGPSRVKLVQGNESEELLLKAAPGPKTTIQPPQPGPAPGAQPGQPGAPTVTPAPPRPGTSGQPGAAPQQPEAGQQPTPAPAGTSAGEQSLLERRRAARAAQAAAEAAARANPPASSAQPAQSGAAAPAPADPAWAEVYRRMQQPRR